MSRPQLIFNPVQIRQHNLVSAAREYKGLPYHRDVTWIKREGKARVYEHRSGIVVGHANCFGVLFEAAKDVGLLPIEFDSNLPPAVWGQPQAKTLVEILHANFKQVPTVYGALSGDVVLFRYRDINPLLSEPHHVGIMVDHIPMTVLHSTEDAGKVKIEAVDPLMYNRIESVWRLKNLFG